MQKMRQMTLECFVKRYLLDLSGQKSLSIHKLAKDANNNERLKNALIFYCYLTFKIKILIKYLKVSDEEKTFLSSSSSSVDDYDKRYDFEKIYTSYRRYLNKKTYDNEIKNSIRLNTLKIMNDKKITKYKIYKGLELNPGNVNDYLTNGNVEKVSLETSKRIYQYCLSF